MEHARLNEADGKLSLWILIATTAAYCVWVMSLPLFPTMDGPMHLYYIHVLGALFQKTPSVYKSYYYIKHILPPYSGYYYTQMALAKLFPEMVADKLIICLYFVLFAFGFRYLATAIGPSGEWMAQAATLLLLSWPLGMGFVNFCLSMAIAMWAVGLWWRACGREDHRRKILFVVLVYVAMLTHPIPLLIIMGCGFAELGVRIIRRRSQLDKTTYDRYLKQDVVYLLLASGSLLYVKLFTVSNMLNQTKKTRGGIHTVSDNAFAYVYQYPLDVFKGHDLKAELYRTALYLILLVPLGLGLMELRRHVKAGVWTMGDTWVALSLLTIIVLPFVPSDLNQAYFFADRLVVVAWLAATAAGSVYVSRSRAFGLGIVGFSLAANVLILTMAHYEINPVAKTIAQIQDVQVEGKGESGLLLQQATYKKAQQINYDPFYWAGAHYFRLHEKLLYNSPWLQLPTLQLGAKEPMPNGKADNRTLESLPDLRKTMAVSADQRSLFLSNVSFVLISRAFAPNPNAIDPILSIDQRSSGGWDCVNEGWFNICDRNTTMVSREPASIRPQPRP